jgi:hypothetical protein
MKYGDTQNLLSVVVGLNLAFYAYKEIRMLRVMEIAWTADALKKSVLGTQELVRSCSSELRKQVQDFCDRVDHVGLTESDVRSLSQNSEALFFGPVCIFVAVAATILLIVWTIKPTIQWRLGFSGPLRSSDFCL